MAKVVFINGGGPKVQQIFEQLAVKGLAAQCLDQSASNEEKKAALAESMVNDVKARGLSVEYLDANLAAPFIKLKR